MSDAVITEPRSVPRFAEKQPKPVRKTQPAQFPPNYFLHGGRSNRDVDRRQENISSIQVIHAAPRLGSMVPG